MTEKERELSRALANCSFLPASWDKRFVNDMVQQSTVTEKQAHALATVAWKYRKQLDPKIRPSVQPRPFGAKPIARTA